MYQTINVHQFRQAFIDMDRKENFSYDGLTALFEFLEEMSQDIGEEHELDVIALCCDFSEIDLDFAIEEYNIPIEYGVDIDEDDIRQQALEWLQEQTTVIPVGDNPLTEHGERVIIQAF